ncbi:MAG: diguanylate cyclase [Thiolinea sp.]
MNFYFSSQLILMTLKFNDKFGHHAGDALLIQFAKILMQESQAVSGGFVTRWG